MCTAPDDLPDRARWARLKGLGVTIGVTIGQTVRDVKETAEARCYILSCKLLVKRFGEAVRSDWEIENR